MPQLKPTRSVKVAPDHLERVRVALKRHGFPSQTVFASEIGLSRSTVGNFFRGIPIDSSNFIEISERLGLNWQAIAYIEEEPPIDVLLFSKEPQPNSETTKQQAQPQEIDWRQVCRTMLEAQHNRRLTTNPLTAGDGVTFELDEIYVPLGLVQRKQQRRVGGDVSPKQGSRVYEPESEDEIVQTFQNEQFFEQVLRPGRSKRIAIIGEPGAGKTTLLQKIAAWVLENTSDVPIWVSLADLQGKNLKEYLLQDWLEAATRKVRVTEAMQEALGELFNNGRVWLLLDAVDEMAVGGQSLAPLQAIANQLIGWVADARVVVTCRLNTWDAGKNALEAFDTYRNLHFSPEHISEFIWRWFKRYPKQGEQLRTTLAQLQRERIRDVIKNPLSLALLCRTWQFGEGELPDTRAGLYEQFVEEIYKWKQERFPTNSQQRQELNQALGQLALQAIDSKASRFRLRHSFVCKVLGNPEAPKFQLALRLGWLNQVGVAAEKNHEAVYAFFHPTFQEYFAAQAIDDWHFFLDHKLHNPAQGIYRIFEPQWKEVIKLWLGREDVEREQKEAFIKALVEFEDKCKGFYRYQAYFLAAAGIAEFRGCSLSDEIVEQILKWAFGCFDYRSQRVYLRSLAEGASVALRESDRNRVINLLSKVIITNQHHQEEHWIWQLVHTKGSELVRRLVKGSPEEIIKALRELFSESQDENIKALRKLLDGCKDERICLEIARLWNRIRPGDPEAVASLNKLKQTANNLEIRYLATDSLRKIGANDKITEIAPFQQISSNSTLFNPIRLHQASLETINKLLEIIQTSQDGATRRQAIKSLGKIGANNPEAVRALIELLHSSQGNVICIEAAQLLSRSGVFNLEVLTTWVELLRTSANDSWLEKAYWNLWVILRSSQSSEVVSHSDWVVALKDCLIAPIAENYTDRYIYCYDLLWHCAQNMSYPAFYQAWHNQSALTPISPQNLSAAHANDPILSSTIHLIYIDGSKFIDRDNPATKIYTEMVKSGCPKCEDGTPKTMQELQAYWDLLESDKHVVLVFYESTKFSETFLDALSKFDGVICVIIAQTLDNIPLQYFSPNQSIADVVEWLKLIAQCDRI